MNYSELGHSGIMVSRVALGCWPFAGGSYWGDQPEALSIATVHAALDIGINFMDTAEGYGEGESERVLGKALKGRRSEAIIASKVDWTNLAPSDIITSCNRSLENLGTDYIDVYYIHWPNAGIPLSESLTALERLKQSGKIRSIAICNFGKSNLRKANEARHCYSSIDAHQLPYSLFWRAIEDELLPKSLEMNMGIVCYSGLAQGLLSGRFHRIEDVPEHLRITRYYNYRHVNAGHHEDGCEEEVFAAIAALEEIAAEMGCTMPQLATAWLLAQGGVSSVLSGARTPNEILENAKALSVRLGDETIQRMRRISDPIKEKLGSNPDMWKNQQNSRFL